MRTQRSIAAYALLFALSVSSLLALSSAALAMQPPSPFEVRRDGNSYHAESQSSASVYSGTLKFVVESAAAELTAAGGGEILFLSGDFDLGSDWFELDGVNDVTFAGQGIDITYLHNFTSAATDTEPFDFVRSDRITIRDMTISAGGSERSTSDVIDFDGGDDNLIERVKITGSRGRGIIFDGKDLPAVTGGTADRNIVRDCIVSGVPRDGIQLLASNSNLIENCLITDAGRDGIRVHKAAADAGQPNKPSNDNVIRNNTVVNSGTNGIRVNSGNRNRLTANTVRNSSDDAGGQDGIRVASESGIACNDNIVEFNTATDDQPLKTQAYGLHITSANCWRTVVEGNSPGTCWGNSTTTAATQLLYRAAI